MTVKDTPQTIGFTLNEDLARIQEFKILVSIKLELSSPFEG